MGETINYVSLGDSIATGTLTPFMNIHSHVFYLKRKFQEQGYQPQVRNLAWDGDASRELLWKLGHSKRVRDAVRQADCITVSIGGNDLLGAMSVPGFTRMDRRQAQAGVKRFAGNWPRIVETIGELNGDAVMAVLNLYNPYNTSRSLGRRYLADRNLCETTDGFLEQINGLLEAQAANRYRIADVYAAFKQYADGNMRRVSCLYQDGPPVLRNPHPTAKGQRIIADLVFRLLSE